MGREIKEYMKESHRDEQTGKLETASHRAPTPMVPKYHHITNPSIPRI